MAEFYSKIINFTSKMRLFFDNESFFFVLLSSKNADCLLNNIDCIYIQCQSA